MAALLAGVALAPSGVKAQSHKATEQQLRQARAELQQIARERRRLEGQRGDAVQRLRSADEQLGRSGRALAETEAALRDARDALADLQRRRQEMQQDLAQRRARLATLLRSAYMSGAQAPLKLLLAQDRIADAQRAMGYYRYVQREQVRQVTELSGSLTALAATEAEIDARTRELEALQAQQRDRLGDLQRDRGAHAEVVAELDQRYQDRQAREQALGQDVKSLERLLANLRAAAARAEAERRAAAALLRPARTVARASRRCSSPTPAKMGGSAMPVNRSTSRKSGTIQRPLL